MVALALIPLLYPLVRIQVMDPGHWTDGSQPWQTLPASRRLDKYGVAYYGDENGFDLDLVERACLPDVGAAVFHIDYGTINNQDYDTDGAGPPGSIYSADNYAGSDVRIQMAFPCTGVSSGFTPSWKTVFLGTVIAVEDQPFAGTDAYGGRRTYRCADLLWRTQRWVMNRHSVYVNSNQITHARGHPGYNWAVQGYYRRVLGNMEPTDVTLDPFGDLGALTANYRCFTWVDGGTADTWNDLQAINHALASSRAKGEPLLAISGSTTILSSGKFAWPVGENEPCWNFLCRILDRKRARGLAFLDWSETPDGNITPTIRLNPQVKNDIVATPPGGGSIVFPGAITAGTTVQIDLNGDERVQRETIKLTYNETASIDYLESQGELMEILATLSPGDGSIVPRWLAADATTYAAIPLSTPWQRLTDRWRPVWQRWGLDPGWAWNVKDGAGGATSYINWYCQDDGTLALGGSSGNADPRSAISPLQSRVLSDIPVYEGYDYTANNHTRYDGTIDLIAPPRLKPLLLINVSGQFYDAAAAHGAGFSNDDWGFFIQCSNDESTGNRTISDTSQATLGAGADATNLAVTVGIQLGVPVRMASANINPATNQPYTALDAVRRKVLKFPGIHLWLADYQAIWSISYSGGVAWARPPQRTACGASSSAPGLLRDDRPSLAQLHALAWAWYSTIHLTGQYTINDCVLLPSFTDASGATIPFPQIGQLVTLLTTDSYAPYDPETPITRVRWERGQSTVVLDWNDLDLAA